MKWLHSRNGIPVSGTPQQNMSQSQMKKLRCPRGVHRYILGLSSYRPKIKDSTGTARGVGPNEPASSFEISTHLYLAIYVGGVGRTGCQVPPESIKVHCGVATSYLGHWGRHHNTVWGWIGPDVLCHHPPFLMPRHTWGNSICRKHITTELAHSGLLRGLAKWGGPTNGPTMLDIFAGAVNVPQGDGNEACYSHRVVWGT